MCSTLLEYAGIPLPPHLQGRSLYPLLTGETNRVRRSALMEHAGWRNLRAERYRYVVRADGAEMFCDLQLDPGEYDNLVERGKYREVLAAMHHALVQHMFQAERPAERNWHY